MKNNKHIDINQIRNDFPILKRKVNGKNLIYFDNSEGVIMHVGILLPDSKIIHASGHVRIDKIDHQGIYRADFAKYTHQTRIIKKML